MEPITFELDRVARGQLLWDSPTRWALVAVGLLAARGGGYFLLRPPTGVSESGWTIAAFTLLIGSGIAALVASSVYLRGGVKEMRLDDDGITLASSRGTPRQIRWNDPGVKILLWDIRGPASSLPGYLEKRTGLMWTFPGRSAFDLTNEAFDGMLAQARSHGLSVKEGVVDDLGLRGVRRVEISRSPA